MIDAAQASVQIAIHAQFLTSRIVLAAGLAGGPLEQRFQELSQHTEKLPYGALIES